MNIPSNLAKSSVLATFVFWIIVSYDGLNPNLLPLIILSFIPVFISCSIVILVTICPFFWLAEAKKFDKQQIFKRYAPYYSIICFGLCLFGILSNSDSAFLIGFFIAVFVTTMQSWVWFAKEAK
uniref:hypothetical protein n=1 Tax=Gelidibacter sp. TaxID=2018083 RepID=UPI0040493E13